MRIVVNDIVASNGGALTVLKDFYNTVKKSDNCNEWIFLLGDNYVEETENIKVITLPQIKNSKIKKLWFDFFGGKKFINDLKPDLVFSLQNIITFGIKVPQYVYIHQSIPFQTVKKFSFLKTNERKLAVYQYLIGAVIKKSAKKADKVFVQTKWMKTAVTEMCGVKSEKIVNVLPTIANLYDFIENDKFKNNFFIYPTGNAVYKNNDIIFKAIEMLKNDGINDFTVELTLNGTDTENIKNIGRIDRNNLLQKYNEGTLIFPSYIETFGYPMAEARKIGTLVLASDCAFSREVLEGYENAYFFNPFSENELADLMSRVITGKIEKKTVDYQENETDGWAEIVGELIG